MSGDFKRVVAFDKGTPLERNVVFNPTAPSRSQSWVADFMRVALIVVGGGACVAVWIASAYFNLVFMSSFAETTASRAIWGATSVGFDVIKSTMPIVMKSTRDRGETATWWLALMLLCITMPMSMLAGFSYAYSSRDKTALHANAVIGERGAAEERLAEMRQRLKLIPVHRQSGVVEAEIAAAKADFRFTRSRDCTAATLGDSMDLCQRYRGLTVELANATDATALRAEIDRMQAKVAGLSQEFGTTPDLQAAMLASIANLPAEVARALVSLILVLTVELISTFGFAVIMTGAKALKDTYEEPAQAEFVPGILEPAMGSFEEGFSRWAGENLAQDAGGRLASPAAYNSYALWTRFNGPYQIPSKEAWGKLFKTHCIALGAQQTRTGGTTAYAGVTLSGGGMQLALPKAAQ